MILDSFLELQVEQSKQDISTIRNCQAELFQCGF